MSKLKRVYVFALVLGLASISDSIMSYSVPVFLNDYFKNAFIAGLVLASSSFSGIFIDIFISKTFHRKGYSFFLSKMFFLALIFPLMFLFLPKHLLMFILAMIIWSAYYEFAGYARFNFVHKTVSAQMYTLAWGIISLMWALALIIGPLVRVKVGNNSLIIADLTVFISYLIFKMFLNEPPKSIPNRDNVRKPIKLQLQTIRVLFGRLWPLNLMVFVIIMIDVLFWTNGVLLSEKLQRQNHLGGYIMSLYALPGLYAGFISDRIKTTLGKKRTAFIISIILGLLLIWFSRASNIYTILTLVLLISTASSSAWVLLTATVEDYVARLKENNNDLIALNQMIVNLGYVLGPIFFGFLYNTLNVEKSFGIAGIIVGACAVSVMIIVPRKIKLPQKQLHEVAVISQKHYKYK